MSSKLKAALIQTTAGAGVERNVAKALRMAERAAARGARFILLPETYNYRGAGNPGEAVPGPSTLPFVKLAKKEKVWILCGSVGEKTSTDKVYNTSVLIDDRGRIAARYRKIHLFNAVLGKTKIRESEKCLEGRRSVIASVLGVPTGLSLCYDVRFPELYHDYAKKGAKILCVPSNFTDQTGSMHWEILLRARAIENQCFVLAPAQCGIGSRGVRTHGRSMAIDPWGNVLARASRGKSEIVFATLDFSQLEKIRKNLPSLKESIRRSA